MCNICFYEMNLKGKPKDIQTLLNWMRAGYNYDPSRGEVGVFYTDNVGNKVYQDHHIGYRNFEIDYDQDYLEQSILDNESVTTIYAYGNCAHSVHSSMLEGVGSYLYEDSFMSVLKKEYSFSKRQSIFSWLKRKFTYKSISLNKACKKLHVEVEIYSSESGCCFAEHYYINKNGKIIVNECTDYQEIYIGDYADYEEYIEDIKKNYPKDENALSVTKEQFDNSYDDNIVFCDWLKESESFEYQYVM